MVGKGAAVKILTIQDGLGDQLFFDPFKPLALDGRPLPHGIDSGHRIMNTLLMADEGVTQGLTADKRDDVRGDLFILPVLPGHLQIPFRKSRPIEGESQFLECLPSQLAGP